MLSNLMKEASSTYELLNVGVEVTNGLVGVLSVITEFQVLEAGSAFS
jgi:hypothetical protein